MMDEEVHEDVYEEEHEEDHEEENEEEQEEEHEEEESIEKKLMSRRRSTVAQSLSVKDERIATVKKVAAILQKPEDSRTREECDLIASCTDIVKEVNRRQRKRDRVKARMEEVEDPPEILEEKCIRLAAAISQAKSLAVYTGAGISTAASIPDYRGTNGVWTRMQQGKDIGNHDLSQAEPTLTHMALYALYKAGILKHVVSQNCDGLHLRSGIPRTLLSEVHGNMYVEVCRECKPAREYWRLFDVTEKTARYAHATGRACHKCGSALQDSIVHFGEKGSLAWPINWSGASKAANQADVILCLGSSLKVLKKYPWLWQMDKRVSKRPQLYIVNLQWTPKDDIATLKISGKCDKIMKIVMSQLGINIPIYERHKDPIFHHAIKLKTCELATTTQPCLEAPPTPESKLEQTDDVEVMKTEEHSVCDDNQDEPEVSEEILPSKQHDNGFDVEINSGSESSIREENRTPALSEDTGENCVPTEEMMENDGTSEADTEEDCKPQIMYHEPITAYPAPFFTALPFLSMGLPFPPLLVYPQLTPIFYFAPILPVPTDAIEAKEDCSIKPKPACTFCMDHEGSLTCLYYQRCTESTSDSTAVSEVQDKVTDENLPGLVTAKNPGWFGKGYRKGMKRKR
ncbi:hypothetical protein QAD02_019061 [Eretmocerus hayati]|uniref:Uncharacterized protein n=1 Tax=Eretmocerus hayati TaxID=131215 RepID=A0ACC2PL16_9HYME|nr:hypothetical protein QAD02_019061 [Eretmocerus hayati]